MNETLRQLKQCLQMLALPVTGQMRLYSGDECGVETLTQTFEESYLAVSYALDGGFTREQAAALAQLSLNLCLLSRQGNAPDWSDIALRTNAGWRAVRRSARRALVAFGWSLWLPSVNLMRKQCYGEQHYVQWQDVRYPQGVPHQGAGAARSEMV